jgi:polyhydroxyalkanoate synthesis repressor PhaR
MSAIKTRVIRKYPNRRLYDTDESRYITLDDVRRLVLEELPFIVLDKKTGADITRLVLLQVINEREHNGDSVFSEGFLAQVIRCQGQADPHSLAVKLESSLRGYITELKDFSSAPAINPLTGGPQMP